MNDNIDNQNDSEEIFNFLEPDDNDVLSEMDGFDLQDLIILLDDYYMQLRKVLGLDNNITFGLEIEYENIKNDKIRTGLCNNNLQNKWEIKNDSTLYKGAEINSPILTDKESSWLELDEVCSIVNKSASIGINSGGHIHVGSQILGDNSEAWLNFIKLWSIYENIIYRFSYGDYLTARPRIIDYAKPTAKVFFNDYKKLKSQDADLYDIISKISHGKYQSVNFLHVSKFDTKEFIVDNTIEFRCPNGSLNPVIWQNNVNLFTKLLNYAKSKNFNDDLVQRRHQLNSEKFTGLRYYDEIYLEQALELCDMVFSNNLDKIYFLKQYLKSLQVCSDNRNYTKAKALTKKK